MSDTKALTPGGCPRLAVWVSERICQRHMYYPLASQDYFCLEMLICSLDRWEYHNGLSFCPCAWEMKKLPVCSEGTGGVEGVHKSTSGPVLQADIWDSEGRQWAAGVWTAGGWGVLAHLPVLC